MSGSALSRMAKRASIYSRAIEALEYRRLLDAHIVGGGGANNFALIQDAIDNCPANGTVLVDPGTYTEQIFLYNGITLKGPQTGIDARSNSRGVAAAASEAILQGTLNGDGTRTFAVKLVGNNCTLDGFTVANQSSTSTVTGAAIVINPTISGTDIINNIIQNSVTGIYLANNSAAAQCVIQRNVIRNNNQVGAAQGFGIYTDGSLTGGTLTNVLIDQNFFYGNLGPDDFLVQPAIGLLAGTASTQTNISITNNVFDTNGKAVLAYNTNGLTITGNTIGNHWDVESAALRFEGGCVNITIQNNNLYGDGSRAIYIDKKGSPADNSGFTVTNNNIYQNGSEVGGEFTGLKVTGGEYTGTLTATNNWWGATSGPGGDFGGSGDNIWRDNVNVVYQPFATSPVIERQGPWTGAPSVVGSPIQSEDFDHGLEGVSYHDTGSGFGGNGGPYRPHQDVEIASTTDGGSGFVVTPSATEWLEYTINIPSAGTFQFDARVQFSSNGGQFHLVKSDGTTTIPGSNVTLNGSSASFQTITKTGLTFDTPGVQIIRLMFDSGSMGQWNWIKLTQTSSSAPTAPSNLQAAIVSASQINLTWQDNSSNEANFILERSTDNINFGPLATPAANTQSYPDTTGLVVGTTYYYRIRATLGGGNDSTNATTSIALTTPTTPSGLAASAASGSGGASQINLTWTDASNNESNFILERSPDNITFTQIATPNANANSHNDNIGLSPKTHYYYRIRATNVVGPSGNSNSAQGTTLAANGLPSPWVNADIGAPVTAGSAGFTLGTFTVNGAGDFWNAADKGNFTYVPVTGDTTIIARVLTVSGAVNAYTGIMIRETLAANSTMATLVIGGTGNIGYIRRTTTGGSASVPNTGSSALPTYLKLARVGNTFTASVGTDGINFPTTIGAVTFTMVSSAFIGIVAANSITAGTGALGTATLSNVSITSIPAIPSGLGASAVSSSQINLTWTDNAVNETGTKIERSLNGTTGWSQIGVADPDMTSYADTTVAGETQYFYRIRSTNGTGDSAYAASANTTTPASWASMSGSTLNITFDGTSTPIALGYGGGAGIVTATKGATTMTFSGVVSIAAAGTANVDNLQLNGALATPLSFTNGNGADSIRLMTGGSYTFNSDLSPALRNITLQIDSGATATIGSTQHLANLIVNGNATISPGGSKVLVTQALTINGKLDIKDNDLVLDYSTVSPVGVWNGSLYDGVTGLIAAGRNGGAWDGLTGIVTSSAVGNFTGIGVADASQALTPTGGMFGTESVDGSAVLVKFTYVGDTNLDGKINIDDYTKIDQGISIGARNWFNGDLNFDGKINIDDYTLIDGNIGNQGGVIL